MFARGEGGFMLFRITAIGLIAFAAAIAIAQAQSATRELLPIDQHFEEIVRWIIRIIELGGILVVVTGVVSATFAFLSRLVRGERDDDPYRTYRSNLGKAILLGLEFLVAADIIRTVTIEPSLENAAVLGIIVVIRTFLSFALEMEIEGRPPWRGAEVDRGLRKTD
jgi:uncharacterized membrane protein